jgi:hypothetical protein
MRAVQTDVFNNSPLSDSEVTLRSDQGRCVRSQLRNFRFWRRVATWLRENEFLETASVDESDAD